MSGFPKKSSPSQAKLELLEKLEDAQRVAEEKLHQTQLQVEALTSKRQQFKQVIAQETDKLLQARQKKLKFIEAEHAKDLQPLQEEIQELALRHEELRKLNMAATADLEAYNRQIVSAKAEAKALTDDIKAKSDECDALILHNDSLVHTKGNYERQKAILQTDILDLEEQKQRLEDTVQTLQDKTTAAEEDFAVKYKQESDRLSATELKAQQVLERIREAEDQQELIRKDLAARSIQADKRDLNLRMRERKVSEGEESIKRNASLLNL